VRASTPSRARPERLDAVFGALSDPIRRAMIARLTRGECSVSDLGRPFSISSPAITKHLDVLEHSGLIVRRKIGRVRYCQLRERALCEAGYWIEQQHAFWQQQLAALGRYLKRDEP
jgi:DNA-binding transcriptional ArsR family regulator